MKRKRPGSVYLQAVRQREHVIDWLKKPGPMTSRWFEEWRQQSLKTDLAASMPVDRNGAEMATEVAFRASATEVFYVTDEIAQFILEASMDMPPFLMSAVDFPTTHGWVKFEKPLNFYPATGHTLKLDAFMWTRESVGQVHQTSDVGPGFLLWDFESSENWGNAYRPMLPEAVEKQIRREMGEGDLFPSAFGTVRDGRVPWIIRELDDLQREPEPVVRLDMTLRMALRDYYAGGRETPFPKGAKVLKDGTEDGVWHFETVTGNRVVMMPDPLCRWLQTFFVFLAQKLPAIEVTTEALPNTWQQRYRHKSINGEPISVITWRRRQESNYQEGTGRTLHFRHVRRGHWRRQWRVIDGQKVQYPIYISPTIVGDESLPFKPNTVVNKVSR